MKIEICILDTEGNVWSDWHEPPPIDAIFREEKAVFRTDENIVQITLTFGDGSQSLIRKVE